MPLLKTCSDTSNPPPTTKGTHMNTTTQANIVELLQEIQKLVEHNEKLNHAFYVIGTPKALKEVMSGQKVILASVRAAITKATVGS